MLGPDLSACPPPPARPTARAGSGGVAPAHLLTLPRLAPEIPPVIELIEGGDHLSPLALAFVEEGLITHADLDRDRRGHLLPICAAAFDRWVQRESAGIKFQVVATFTDDWPDHFGDLTDSFDVRGGEKAKKRLNESLGGFLLVLRSDEADWALVGPRCTALETWHAGLGASVLRLTETALGQTVGGFGPTTALGVAQQYHWRGEANHNSRLDEMEEEEGSMELTALEIDPDHGPVLILLGWGEGCTWNHQVEVATIDLPPELTTFWLRAFDFSGYEFLTTPEFHRHLPEWCCDFSFRPFSARKLREIALTGRMPAGLADIVLFAALLADTMKRHPVKGDHHHFYSIGNSLSPILLGWSREHDMVARMYDDYAQDIVNSGEGTAVRSIWLFKTDNIRSIRAALAGLRNCFAVLRSLHICLNALATRT
jgi:hypothetical protein